MDRVSAAASVIAVIQLTGSLVKLCGGYIQEVKDARDEIYSLNRSIEGIEGTLQDLQKSLQSDDGKALLTSSRLTDDITECHSDLRNLEAKLDSRKGKKLMRKVGLRALKWPLKRAEVESMMQNLKRYKYSFHSSLQGNQTSLIVGMAQDTDYIYEKLETTATAAHTVSFPGSNSGLQVGINTGPINAEFHLPPSSLDKLPFAHDAALGSYADQYYDECLEGTRTDILHKISEWAFSPHERSIFWLQGMAGTGKSTISRTVANSLKHTHHLGASFFFKRGEEDRGNAKKIFPTLIKQLMLRISGLKSGVQKALDHDPEIATKSLKEQFEQLLLQPLLNLNQLGRHPQTAVIVIDALDECDHDQDIRTIIRLLPILQRAKVIRLRIFLTSRPELPINLGFSDIADHKTDLRESNTTEIFPKTGPAMTSSKN
ncbi:hypothetical protein PMG11_04369 [Penicillium brasilianum]|uniref:NACHT domain-containing protein n=1 Tax=Penicillium brasilianum TaxID=104259 RepID=A0A0F7VJ36_PENBI|nr:hypothetical protein PMG11_04369 [Penicillium brasilianum]